VLTIRERHALRNDNTVQHATTTYLLEARWPGRRPKTIDAEVRLDGQLYLLTGDQELRYRPPAARPAPVPSPARPRTRRRAGILPAPDHPWRQFERVQRLTAFKNRTVLMSSTEDIAIGR
jgi:hypothetical protein